MISMAKPQKITTLDAYLAKAEKEHGSSGGFFRVGASTETEERLPTGIYGLDLALGGGFTRGKLVSLSGATGGGKSSLTMMITAQAQRLGGKVVFIDLEGGYNEQWAEDYGVDQDELIQIYPASAEEALEALRDLVQTDASVVILDSVAGLVPEAVSSGDMGDEHVARLPRLLSRGIPQVIEACAPTCTPILVNQLREKVGMTGYGPSTTRPGGRAVPFFESFHCEITRVKNIQASSSDATVIGHTTKVRIPKNRFGIPFREVLMDCYYKTGFDNSSTTLNLAVEYGFIDAAKTGWHTNLLTGEKFARSRLKAISWLNQNPEDRQLLEEKITEAYEERFLKSQPEAMLR